MSQFKQLIHEIHRRSLWQVLGIYAASGWIVLGAVGTLAESLGLPEWAPRFALFLLIIGLPIVLATAFVQEGIRSRADAGGPDVDAGSAPAATRRGDTSAAGLKARLTWRRALLGGLVAFSLLFGFAGLWVFLGDRDATRPGVETAEAVEADPAVAVLPFTFRGAGFEMWGQGMVDLLSPMVDGVAGLRAINNRTVLARWGERVSDGEAADLETLLEVARAAGARYALVGSGIASGETVRLDLDLYDTRSGERIDRARVEGPADDMLAVVDRAAAETVRAVLEAQGRISDFKLVRLTDSPEALVAFLEGEVAARAFRNVEAWDAYSRAVDIDTAFAFAHLRFPHLAQWGATALRPTGRHWDAAARHLDRLDERSTLRVRTHEAAGEERLRLRREAVARLPDDATLWYDLAEDLIHGSTGFPSRDEIEAIQEGPDLGERPMRMRFVRGPNLEARAGQRMVAMRPGFDRGQTRDGGSPQRALELDEGYCQLELIVARLDARPTKQTPEYSGFPLRGSRILSEIALKLTVPSQSSTRHGSRSSTIEPWCPRLSAWSASASFAPSYCANWVVTRKRSFGTRTWCKQTLARWPTSRSSTSAVPSYTRS